MTQADTQRDPFIECYRAWLKQKAFSTGTGADFLASFSNTSGDQLQCRPAQEEASPPSGHNPVTAFRSGCLSCCQNSIVWVEAAPPVHCLV